MVSLGKVTTNNGTFPGKTGHQYFNHICGSLLNFKKSYSSHLNILRSIVPQMFMTVSIKKIEQNFNQLSVNYLKYFFQQNLMKSSSLLFAGFAAIVGYNLHEQHREF